jgi:hypothetical protein
VRCGYETVKSKVAEVFSGPKNKVEDEKADPIEEHYKRELQKLKMFADSYTIG